MNELTKSSLNTKKLVGTLLTGLLVFMTTTALASGRGLYRWVDDKGVVHYGDHVPAEFSKTERHVLNRQAIVVQTLAAQKSKEQLQLEAEERLRQAELRRIAAEKAHRDRILLASYSGPQDIDRALSEAQKKIDQRINVVNINIENLQKQRATILDRIGYFSQNESETDEDTLNKLEDQLSTTNDELSNGIALRNTLKSDRSDLAVRYQSDKQRLATLRLQREEKTMAETHPLL